MTTLTTVGTGQIDAAGALLAILSANSTLPAPTAELRELPAHGRPWTWGVRLALHDGLDQFEQWRAALGLDPAAVDHKKSYGGTLAWLIVTGERYGVPVELVSFYDLPDTDQEELS
ncbi:hypothetical protein OG535_21290 [Kitasatospora sp. NBC_00085]|uniref:hypothetical protein n=1 Tax=unclassified Kitasatospora TaxID=2633591 RepID=UPI00324C341F